MSYRRRRRLKLRSLYVWHRYAGVGAALFALLLAATGVLLNHTERLSLDSRYATADWLLNWYGIRDPNRVRAFAAGEHWVSQWGERLYFDRRSLGTGGRLLGAVALEGLIAVAAGGEVRLLTPAGEQVEVLRGAQGVPAGLQRIGRAGQRLALQTDQGVYRADAQLLSWEPMPGAEVAWATPQPLPDPLHDALSAAYRGTGLPLERVILDLHSGRIFGPWGVYLMDLAALGMAFLAGSGLWLWTRRWWQERSHRRARATGGSKKPGAR